MPGPAGRAAHTAALAFRTARDSGARLIAYIAGLQIVSIVGLLVQLLAGRRILADLSAGRPVHVFVTPTVIVIAAFAVSAVATALTTPIQHMLAERVSRQALSVVLRAAAAADLIEFESPALHDRLQRALINASSRPTQMTLGLLSVLSSLGSFVVLAVLLVFVSPLLFGIAVVVAVPLTVIAFGSSRALFDFAVRQTHADRERMYVQFLLTSRDQAKEVRAYGLGSTLLARWRSSYDARLADLGVLLRQRTRRMLLAAAVATVALAIGLIALVWSVSTHRVTFASGATAAAALLVMSRQAQTLASGMANLYETTLFMTDYRHLADESARAADESRPHTGRHRVGTGSPRVAVQAVRSATAPDALERITASELTFTYPGGHRPAVHRVSLDIARGEIIALVGENGSGKSTLAKIIAGLYTPQFGAIAWNGAQYPTVDLDAMRGQIAVLFQDYIKFQMSVRENITMGDPSRPADDLGARRAAQNAGAADFVADLPSGYDTELGPQFVGGTELSGGQWQRLALARASYRPASLVILDEPTAALDPRAEERLFRATRDVFADRAVLLISHRFSSVRQADRIYVMADGRIVEQGKHEDLMAEGGLYADLYRAQHEALLGPAPDVPDVTG